MKPSAKNYLHITKTEWNGLVVLLGLIAVVIACPYVYKYYHVPERVDFTKLNIAVAQLKRAGVTGSNAPVANATNKPADLFAFNPNHLPEAKWKQLGLTDRQIKGIKNYETAGGRFYSKADVKKMYTLSTADYERLQPYINIPDGEVEKISVVELNAADSATLTRLKGIGPTFARRIIQYRNRLGGFHKKQQLKEIFGIDDMHYEDIQSQFKVNPRKVKKIDINNADMPDLKNFP